LQCRGSLEGPPLFQAFGEKKKRNDDDHDAHRDRGPKRPIECRTEEALHHVRDHGAGSTADEKRSKEIAKRENEGERGSGNKSGDGEGKNNAKKSLSGAGTEVLRGFDERAGNVFERGVDRQKNEWRVDVREHEDDCEGAVEQKGDGLVGEMQILEEAI
jgi:hypothetical protein